MGSRSYTAIIERDDDGFFAFCPEVDIAGHGETAEEARSNLIEELTLFFKNADASEIARRTHADVSVTQIEIPVDKTPNPNGHKKHAD